MRFCHAIFCCLFLFECAAGATFVPINEPNSAYLKATSLLSFDTSGFAAEIWRSVSPGEEVTYDSSLSQFQVPFTWSAWNTPPSVEDPAPTVGLTQSARLVISFQRPASVFGLEIEPNVEEPEPVSAIFYGLTRNILGTVQRVPNGNAGALLFAAVTTKEPFAEVSLADLSGNNFGIADLRYSALVAPPEIPNPMGKGFGRRSLLLSASYVLTGDISTLRSRENSVSLREKGQLAIDLPPQRNLQLRLRRSPELARESLQQFARFNWPGVSTSQGRREQSESGILKAVARQNSASLPYRSLRPRSGILFFIIDI